jgi:hypothetical protein
MRSPTKQDGTDRRSTERRSETARTAGSRQGNGGERRVVEQRGVVTSMVDALEDILKWERASERAMRVATEQSTTELDPSN